MYPLHLVQQRCHQLKLSDNPATLFRDSPILGRHIASGARGIRRHDRSLCAGGRPEVRVAQGDLGSLALVDGIVEAARAQVLPHENPSFPVRSRHG
jgi:hypothetical protein